SADGRASCSAWAIYEQLKISCTSLRKRGLIGDNGRHAAWNADSAQKLSLMRHQSDRPMKPSAKVISTALLLIGCASTASAQGYWCWGIRGPKQRGYSGTQ